MDAGEGREQGLALVFAGMPAKADFKTPRTTGSSLRWSCRPARAEPYAYRAAVVRVAPAFDEAASGEAVDRRG